MLKLLFLALNAAKLGKVLMSGGTMLISVFAYAWIFGWRYAVGFVALLFAHEMGHFIAARQRGLEVGLPTFIPFVGAWVAMKQLPHDAETEAYVGMGGPFVGSLAALAVWYAARALESPWMLALAYSGFFLNLFNLIPLSPFDGGRITAVISPRLWMIGVPILVAVFMVRPSPLLVLVALLAVPHVLRTWRGVPAQDTAYYLSSMRTRVMYGAGYIGLAAFLAVMCDGVHRQLTRG